MDVDIIVLALCISQVTGLIKHTRRKQCVDSSSGTISLATCDETKDSQQWVINQVRTW